MYSSNECSIPPLRCIWLKTNAHLVFVWWLRLLWYSMNLYDQQSTTVLCVEYLWKEEFLICVVSHLRTHSSTRTFISKLRARGCPISWDCGSRYVMTAVGYTGRSGILKLTRSTLELTRWLDWWKHSSNDSFHRRQHWDTLSQTICEHKRTRDFTPRELWSCQCSTRNSRASSRSRITAQGVTYMNVY